MLGGLTHEESLSLKYMFEYIHNSLDAMNKSIVEINMAAKVPTVDNRVEKLTKEIQKLKNAIDSLKF